IYVTDNTVYILDGRTYEEIGELTPDIGAQPIRGCNGCQMARDVYVYPDQDLLLVDVTVLSAGKGAGAYPPPRYFSLRSREPLTYPVAASFTCGGKMELRPPIEGVLYTTAAYARYVFHQNLVALQAGTGRVLRWRDGINASLVVAGTGVIYCERGDEAGDLALDLYDWTPLGYVPHYCIHTLDLSRQRLYATDAARLIVLRDRGGQPMPTPTPEVVATLPAIQAIHVSPDYADDRTIFISGNGSLFRSQDAGTSWVRLRGGLPSLSHYAAQFKIAFSPAFVRDRTVYAAAFAGDAIGYGVLRSTDGGDTWQMLWRGLDHLRVYDVILSPKWVEDGALIAYAHYQQVTPKMESGESVFRSADRGEHWELVAMRPSSDTSAPPLPKPEELLPLQRPLVEIISRDHGRTLERTWNSGRS
ncbi:MAG: hypothetical protein H5T63_00965, partial [Chloroflexi bacterium]|nr:hypothetical protein [Chloroflexota bacterium]